MYSATVRPPIVQRLSTAYYLIISKALSSFRSDVGRGERNYVSEGHAGFVGKKGSPSLVRIHKRQPIEILVEFVFRHLPKPGGWR